MTKKRFYKLLRSELVKYGCLTKEHDRTCKRMRGIQRTSFDPRGYGYLWDVVNGGHR